MSEIEEINGEFTEFCERQQPQVEQTPRPVEDSVKMSQEMNAAAAEDQRTQGRRWVEKTLARILEDCGMKLDTPSKMDS